MTTENREQPKRKLSLAELEPVIRDAFEAGMTFQLPVTGTSNLPTLKEGRDQVILDRVEAPLKKGDLPLYRRDNGQYVLHRIVSVQKDGTYTCCGDHQWKKEPGIRQEQLIGLTVQLIRKGRPVSVSQLGYRLWVRTWVLLFACRRPAILAAHAIGRLKRRQSPG